MITVLLADDVELMRKAIVGLLKADPEVQVLAEATSLMETMQLTSKLRPHVVVMDIHMGDEKKRDTSAGQIGLDWIAIAGNVSLDGRRNQGPF